MMETCLNKHLKGFELFVWAEMGKEGPKACNLCLEYIYLMSILYLNANIFYCILTTLFSVDSSLLPTITTHYNPAHSPMVGSWSSMNVLVTN